MIELHSYEAETAVIGSMLMQPHLIDIISDGLSADAFAYKENEELYKIILDLHSEGVPIDVVTMGEKQPTLSNGKATMALAGEIQMNTPSAANAKVYAQIIRDRAVSRQIAAAGAAVGDIAHTTGNIEDKIAQAQAAVLGLDSSGSDAECIMTRDLLMDHMEILQDRHDRAMSGETIDGLASGIPDLDKYTQGMKPGQMIVVAGRPSMGKAQPLSAKVLRADGSFKTMGEVVIGDRLASVDGEASMVVGVYPQGIRPVYRIALTDGRTVEADADHLWAISSSKWAKGRTVTTTELQRLLSRVRYRNRITLATHDGQFGEPADLGVDPWLIGFLIGDGGLTESSIRFSTQEEYILKRVEAASGITPKHRSASDYALTTPRGQPNPLLDAMRDVGLMGLASHKKTVPSKVFSASREVRRGVLAGLLESDGWIEKAGSVVFASSSEQLRDDVVALVESLGGSCAKSVKSNCGYKMANGEKKICRDSHIAYIKLNSLREFIRSPRLLKNLRDRYYTDHPYVASVSFVRNDEAVCIKVSHPSELYLTDGWVVTHNTTLAMNMASEVAINQKKPVVVISLEMSRVQLMDRLLASIGGIPLDSIKNGSCASEYGDELALAAVKLRDSPIAVSDVPVMTINRIRSIVRRQKHRMGGMGLVVIDYLGLVEGDSGNGRTEDVTAMSRQIKLLAREIDCPVVILSQLNRSCENRPDKRPVLSDLRESGAIEQDADIVMFVYRDEVYNENTHERGVGEILIRKNRDGEIGTVRTAFQGDKSRFVPIAFRQDYGTSRMEAGF